MNTSQVQPTEAAAYSVNPSQELAEFAFELDKYDREFTGVQVEQVNDAYRWYAVNEAGEKRWIQKSAGLVLDLHFEGQAGNSIEDTVGANRDAYVAQLGEEGVAELTSIKNVSHEVSRAESGRRRRDFMETTGSGDDLKQRRLRVRIGALATAHAYGARERPVSELFTVETPDVVVNEGVEHTPTAEEATPSDAEGPLDTPAEAPTENKRGLFGEKPRGSEETSEPASNVVRLKPATDSPVGLGADNNGILGSGTIAADSPGKQQKPSVIRAFMSRRADAVRSFFGRDSEEPAEIQVPEPFKGKIVEGKIFAKHKPEEAAEALPWIDQLAAEYPINADPMASGNNEADPGFDGAMVIVGQVYDAAAREHAGLKPLPDIFSGEEDLEMMKLAKEKASSGRFWDETHRLASQPVSVVEVMKRGGYTSLIKNMKTGNPQDVLNSVLSENFGKTVTGLPSNSEYFATTEAAVTAFDRYGETRVRTIKGIALNRVAGEKRRAELQSSLDDFFGALEDLGFKEVKKEIDLTEAEPADSVVVPLNIAKSATR